MPGSSPRENRSPKSPRSPKDDIEQDPEDAEAAAHQAEHTIEAGEEDEFESGYVSDAASAASTSLSSSVRDYAFENGRRYHKFREGHYQFPVGSAEAHCPYSWLSVSAVDCSTGTDIPSKSANDEPEQAREDMKHAMIVNLCGGALHYSPLQNPQRILDMGTGTGIWAIDMGDEYPSAEILGIDLSPIQPLWVPPNVKFMVDDFESQWLHGDNYFDYVHGRHLSVAVKNMPKVLKEAYRSMKPGGWIELQDLLHKAHCDDGTMPETYLVQEWLGFVAAGLAALGPDLLAAEKNAQYLRDAGFVNVQERIFKVPIGLWPKNKKLKMVGLYGRMMIYDGLEGNSLGPFTRGLGWSPERVQVYLIGVRKALLDNSVHAYLPFHCIYGQKPQL
ncbi:hypothetical protein EG329_013260 [Mollisiaceae sp. DMI_Dod_QoI]|nr:hypothetical protein EG329_013260 [Helotiales sp. DMI_Dod_QoI]